MSFQKMRLFRKAAVLLGVFLFTDTLAQDVAQSQEACPIGYRLSGNRCRNINECAIGTDNCDLAALCTDTLGSFTCTCPKGKAGSGVACYDVDECADPSTNDCDVRATCTTRPEGGHKCTCTQGYAGNGRTCTLIPKDTKGDCGNPTTNDCSENAACTDLPTTGHVCTCNDGYTGNGIFCTPEIDDALAIQALQCSVGFQASQVKGKLQCRDINECDTGLHACDKNADCRNTAGSYACTCQKEYVGNGTACILDACRVGFSKNTFGACVDVDECATGKHKCDANSACSNFEGGFNCTCNSGYVLSTDGESCVPATQCNNGFLKDANGACADQDECMSGSHNCDVNAFCQNTRGSFVCSCRNGFAGDGLDCKRVTSCPKGFTRIAESCQDTDECNDGAHNCDESARCTNTPGSFTCACNFGFTGNGITCSGASNTLNPDDTQAQLNALADRRCAVCDKNAICKRVGEDLFCECKKGYTGDGKSCVDESKRCPPGLTFDEATNKCVDIDECKTKQRTCPSQAVCVNTNGSSYCRCNSGFAGPGCTVM